MEEKNTNFIHDIIDEDLASGREDHVHTRFPPEPNGYLHIGSAKAIWINWNTAKKYGGKFNLRYDDTNPEKESDEFVKSIYEDILWLGAEPDGGVYYGSDYFDKCFEFAVKLIKDGKAYVCDLTPEQTAQYRGDFNTPGKNSPYRDRTVEENLLLFEKMKNGEFEDGEKTLRAKIDMSSPNMTMRDPVIYRIKKGLHHHRQGDKWCIYPMYDFAHPIQDAIEGITHSCCSDEFKNNRPMYNWVVDNIGYEHKPHQYEFGRMNVTYTVVSKRYLRELVYSGSVDGWDDPRMPTICALRRRGYTPSAIFEFIKRAGVSPDRTTIDVELLEYCIRTELNEFAPRRVAVADPVKVVITNYPEDKTEYFSLPNNPKDESAGTRELPFTKELYIDSSDFAEIPPPKFFRLKPEGEVRLMGSYIIKLDDIIKNDDGTIKELLCTADLETGCGVPADGRKIKGTIHWLSARHAKNARLYFYDRLFTRPDIYALSKDENLLDFINPESLRICENAKIEPDLAQAKAGDSFQFVRSGYFCKDTKNEDTFNLIVGLKEGYKIQ